MRFTTSTPWDARLTKGDMPYEHGFWAVTDEGVFDVFWSAYWSNQVTCGEAFVADADAAQYFTPASIHGWTFNEADARAAFDRMRVELWGDSPADVARDNLAGALYAAT